MLMKKNVKNGVKSQIISWQNPVKIAQIISQNYQENWVFLYSALHQEKSNSKSYIALFEKQKYSGNDFKKLQEIIEKSDNEMWFGGLSYEVANQFEQLPKTTKSFIEMEEIFFSNFELIELKVFIVSFCYSKRNCISMWSHFVGFLRRHYAVINSVTNGPSP